MSQRMPDYEALRAQQARSQQSDRVAGRVQRDLTFATQASTYGAEWIDELDKV